MARPVSEEQSERAATDVLERLRIEDARILSFPVAVAAQPQPVRTNVWGAVAAGIVVMLAGGLLPSLVQRTVGIETVARPVSGEIELIGASTAFPSYSKIEAGKVVRAGNEGGAIVLLDGSQIDMSPEAELSIDREADGLRVRLASGTVLVTAAKQREGHLYVETKDCVVSVTGTVFAVSAGERGSRVAVLEGAVQIRRGEVSQTLLAGEQATTSSQLGPLPPGTGPGAPERLAALQQPPAQPQTPGVTKGSTVRGVVKATNGAGIPDVSVTICPNFTAVKSVFVPQAPPARGFFEDIVQIDGPIVRNKAFFYGIWDNCVHSTVVTDSMGRFEFSNVAAGEYAVRALREGFSGPAADFSMTDGDGGAVLRYFKGTWTEPGANSSHQLTGDSMRVTVYAQQASQDISLSLIRAGVISGHVRDADGKLVVNAQVRVVASSPPGTAAEGPIVLKTSTNDLGEYRAYWLTPGEYRVVATGARSPEAWVARPASPPEGTVVVLREGEEVRNIDLVLRPRADNPTLNPYFAPIPRE
jgi:hypothetical protein